MIRNRTGIAIACLSLALFSSPAAQAACDTAGLKPVDGIQVKADGDGVSLTWQGEA